MCACSFPVRRVSSLPGSSAEAREKIGRRGQENQGRQPLLVVVPGSLVPDRIGDRVRLIGDPGESLSEREGGAFGGGKAGGIPPGRDLEDPLVGFTGLLEEASMLHHADVTA